jgi:hypothetical protein
MKKQTIKMILVGSFLLLPTACKKDGFSPGSELSSIGEAFELVYGSTASDRAALAARLSGSSAPQLADVLARWRRFSGSDYYPSLDSIVANPSYCNTYMDGFGSWAMGTNPGNGLPINPNTDALCNTPSMNSLSWVYLSGPDRIHNIQNTNNYNGFFSSIKFDNFIAEATLSSTNADNDAIGMTIAAYVDSSNNTHTLSAYRTQGGWQPTAGWGLVHKVNNTVTRIIDNKTVGANSSGWSGRNSQIRIERTGNIVKAYCSPWAAGLTPSAIDEASLIQVDLSDPAEGLTEFIGPQSYGYETQSQPNATFSLLNFTVPQSNSDPQYIYDLHTNQVYEKATSGIGYQLVIGLNAMTVLGFPKTIINVETQREFTINSASSFTETL